ncbi:MAG TPA: hypothetical protein VJ743_13570 [Albitalea sp.]|nr:hypothetical protein [Albitalea sp.]
MKMYQLALALPFLLAIGVAAHWLIARVVKAVLWSWSPLATGEPEAAAYERRVYHSADMPMMQIVAAAALSGLPWWVALATGSGLWWAAGFLAIAGVVALDVARWERVAVSAHNLWFQRGYRGRVHQVAMDNIRDASVEEMEVGGFTLRHGRHNRLVRLNVRMKDKRLVALPKTDADRGLDEVEAVANHLRMRLQQLRDSERSRTVQPSGARAKPPVSPSPEEQELQRALNRLRHGALKRAAR